MSAINGKSKVIPTPAPTRLRQIALVAADLQKARQLLTNVLGTEVIFEDPAVEQWGLKNILVAIGGDVIEVVSPFKSGTTASRLLSKRGDGGYMLIMQTLDAKARLEFLESTSQAKCIFLHESEDAVCIQYHPKGIAGGMMPELDSHITSRTNQTPVESRFSPWHACGPLSTYPVYCAGMRRQSDLHLLSVQCRLAPGETDTAAAAQQWERLFGIEARDSECSFTNAKLRFIEGQMEEPEGLVEIRIGVEGQARLRRILEKATEYGLSLHQNWAFSMLGIRWVLELVNQGHHPQSRL